MTLTALLCRNAAPSIDSSLDEERTENFARLEALVAEIAERREELAVPSDPPPAALV